MRAIEVVSRSVGNSSVVNMGPSAKEETKKLLSAIHKQDAVKWQLKHKYL